MFLPRHELGPSQFKGRIEKRSYQTNNPKLCYVDIWIRG